MNKSSSLPITIKNECKEKSVRWTNEEWLKLYKYGGLIMLCLQQTSMPLMTRAARDRNSNEVFLTTVNVFMMDILKLFFCIFVLIIKEKSFVNFYKKTVGIIFGDWRDTLKLGIPSILYILQNNLYYISLSNLEPTTFCVCYQMKIFTTAIMLRMLLNKKLSTIQWVALLFLLFGVVEVQMQYSPPISKIDSSDQNPTIGFITVFLMCFTSAFAGAYMEKCLKKSDVDIWTQNIRLSLYGLAIGGGSMIIKDFNNIQEYGMFHGFDILVWILTAVNSVGGLLIALVMKYADNILKGYAQSMSIVGAAVGSMFLFNFSPNFMFLFGTANVILSIILYSNYPYVARS
ncbi:UDP-galactose translocator [Strongyloides ratti]|uniref:UDP-galactose translocator n=1 Tax=Strongyloides ratti TaxID=34506 RepID=A0A090L063_STRRB|nr:UDP-galactose translocator [Strongyloides ratti]CEF63155.1 UDP-galactose translocator [Strongyloides ratti]